MSIEGSSSSPEDLKGSGEIRVTMENVYSTPEQEISKWRRYYGYSLIIVSVSMFLAIAFLSGAFIDRLEPKSSAPHVFDYIRLAARAILTGAVAVFAYNLLRAGERLILPLTLVKNAEDLKVVLGFPGLKNTDGVVKDSDLFKALIDIIKYSVGDRSK